MAERQIKTPLDAGLIIRERRKSLKLGQQVLADQVGVSRKWLVGLENGRQRTDFGLVLRTFNALGLTILVSDDLAGSEAGPNAGINPQALDIDAVIRRTTGMP